MVEFSQQNRTSSLDAERASQMSSAERADVLQIEPLRAMVAEQKYAHRDSEWVYDFIDLLLRLLQDGHQPELHQKLVAAGYNTIEAADMPKLLESSTQWLGQAALNSDTSAETARLLAIIGANYTYEDKRSSTIELGKLVTQPLPAEELPGRVTVPIDELPSEVFSELGALFAPDGENEEEWQERALCAQTDPEVFFPEKGGSTREAKRVCMACEVRAECLDHALDYEERFGIWGGLSERERRKLKRRT